jgi:hypothetical protein
MCGRFELKLPDLAKGPTRMAGGHPQDAGFVLAMAESVEEEAKRLSTSATELKRLAREMRDWTGVDIPPGALQ